MEEDFESNIQKKDLELDKVRDNYDVLEMEKIGLEASHGALQK